MYQLANLLKNFKVNLHNKAFTGKWHGCHFKKIQQTHLNLKSKLGQNVKDRTFLFHNYNDGDGVRVDRWVDVLCHEAVDAACKNTK